MYYSDKYRYALFVTSLLILIVFITGCVKFDQMGSGTLDANATLVMAGEVEKQYVTIYLVTRRGGYLVPINIKLAATERPVWATLERLICGNTELDGIFSPIPANTKIRDMYIKCGTAYIDFSGEFATELRGKTKNHCRRAVDVIVWTLTEFPDIEKVQILIDGMVQEELAEDVPINIPLERPLWINKVSGTTADALVVLYFDYQGKFLVPISRQVEDFSHSLSQMAIEELFKGPEGLVGIESVIPAGITLRSYKVEQGTAFVDLTVTEEAADRFWSYDDKFLRALVYTLREFSHIKNIQIMLNGKIAVNVNDDSTATDVNCHPPLVNLLD
ncbi:MAG: GerMN domain-containing protein [bacterium]